MRQLRSHLGSGPALWLAISVLAASAGPSATQEPTFRSGVDLVTVDAAVIGREGRPVADLGPDDFQLKVDGQIRRVVSAQFVSEAESGSRARLLSSSHFTSNEEADAGRVVIVAVDQANIRRVEGRPALAAAASFIAKLEPADRVGVTGLGRLAALELTRDHAGLLRSLAKLVGETDPVFLQFNLGLNEAMEIADGSPSRLADAVLRECGRTLSDYVNPARAASDAAGRDPCPEQVEQEARAVSQHARSQARISMASLEALLRSLSEVHGPKTLLLLSEGLVADPRYFDFGEIAAAAQESRVSIYVLQLEIPLFEAAQDRVSPTFLQDVQRRGDGLARLAGAARGALFRLVGSDPAPFDRVLREISGYYLLAFEPIEADRDGRIHRIDVSLARGGGELRARQAFKLPLAAPAMDVKADRLTKLLRATNVATELPLRVATYSYAEPGSANVRVVVSAEADSAGGAASRVLLGFVLVDNRGIIAATATHEVDSGRYSFSAVVPPAAYSLRVGAIDALGRHGSVFRPFEARVIESGSVGTSDLILAPVPAREDAQIEPVVDRGATPSMLAYLEVYGRGDAALVEPAVRIDITRDGEAGPVIVSVPATLTGLNERWAVARAILPTGKLTRGRYLARAEVSAGGAPIARVSRPFAIP